MKYDNYGAIDGGCPTSLRPGFTSFKNVRPIRYIRRWHRDMLIQLVLDPTVVAMEQPRNVGDRSDFRVTVRTAAGVLDLVAVQRVEDVSRVPRDGWAWVPRSNVVRQPRMGTARMIWAARGRAVPAGDRLQILMAIESQDEGVTVGSLLAASTRSPGEQAEAVFALACEGLLVIDLALPFALSTRVRSASLVGQTSELDLAMFLQSDADSPSS